MSETKTSQTNAICRRRFLQGAATLAAAPTIVRAAAWGAEARPAPSNRINMACIGFRNMGGGHLRTLLGDPTVQVVALCDVDAKILADGKARAEKAYADQLKSGSYKGVFTTGDFRDIMARDDVDAVMVATPDHWHTLVSLAAVRSGKDVYCEKPLTLTIAEGRVLSDTVRRYGRVLQTGSQQRSSRNFRFACELARNGRLGQVHTVEVGLPPGKSSPPVPPQPVPPELDYEMWLGQAPWEPYNVARCHYNFRWNLDYSGGQITNFGAHDLDIAQWGLGMDDSGPVEIEGVGEFPPDGPYNTATRCRFEFKYANGVKLVCTTGSSGVKFIGSDGWVYVNRGTLQASPASLLGTVIGPDEIHLYESRSHWGNFFECVRTRRPPIATVEIGHRTATCCHLANSAMLLGRKLRWDPAAENFVNDPEADRMSSRAIRAPWHL